MTDQNPAAKKHLTPARITVWAGLVLFLAVIALGLLRSQNRALAVGEAMPDFSINTFDGRHVQASDLNGKVVVVNFWASWCKPCEEEAADLQTAWLNYKERGVEFLGVDYVDTEPEALKYLQKFQITYPNGADLGTRISQAFRTRGVPETYIFNSEGRLVHVQIGPFSDRRQLEAIINPLLPEK